MDKVFVDGAKICPKHFASDTDNNLYVPGLFAGTEYLILIPLSEIEVSFIVSLRISVGSFDKISEISVTSSDQYPIPSFQGANKK